MIVLKKSHFILIALLIAALIFLALKFIQNQKNVATGTNPETKTEAQTVTKSALTVNLVRPARSTIKQKIAANGSISPWQEAVIGSEVNGLMLTEVLVNVGDNVKKGQLLAQFGASTIAADMAQSQASLAEAKANAAEAADNAARARSIKDSGALSTQQIEQYLALETTSNARVAAAIAALQSNKIRNKQRKVIAPDNGIISARLATVGAVASPGQELFKLIRQGRLEWRAELTSSDINQVKKGMIANLTLPDGSTITGKVRTTSPMIEMQTRNAIVFVDIANGEARGHVKAGMFAQGKFDIGAKEVLTLPTSAIVMKDGFSYAMQVGSDNRVKQIKIQTGDREGSNIEVIGLNAAVNSNFVASGGAFLADGDLVTVGLEIAGQTPTSTKSVTQSATNQQE